MKEEKENKKIEEDEIDIDLDDPEVADAALKIQAGFKGHQARKQVQEIKEEKKQADILKKEGEEVTIDIDLDDPEVGDAALKIQAGFKGYQARKQVKEMEETADTKKKEDEEEIDIDLDDPEVGDAALKIQAGFKG